MIYTGIVFSIHRAEAVRMGLFFQSRHFVSFNSIVFSCHFPVVIDFLVYPSLFEIHFNWILSFFGLSFLKKLYVDLMFINFRVQHSGSVFLQILH